MNREQIAGDWKLFRGKVKEKSDELTHDRDRAAGRRDQLVGALRARYGWEGDRAERELDELVRTR